MDLSARRAAFRRLHENGCFVIPNPWDNGSARYLQQMGFKALATTSAGFAFSRGLPDAEWAVPRDLMLEHIATLAAAVDVPVNADFQAGYGSTPDDVAESVRLCVEAGVAGLSIEDRRGDRESRYTICSWQWSESRRLGRPSTTQEPMCCSQPGPSASLSVIPIRSARR